MKALLFAASALTLASVPAQAQLLGGSGSLGGSLGGTIGSSIDTSSLSRTVTRTVRATTDSVESTTRAAADSKVATSGDQNVDSSNGSVSANRSANAGLTGNVSQLASIPMTTAGGSASGSGEASGNGSAGAQLIGTDAIGGLANSGVSQAQTTVGIIRGVGGSTAGRATGSAGSLTSGVTGTATGNASGEASGNGGLTSMPLAVAGSGAANGQGAFGVAPGMPVLAPSGEQIGKVRELVANGRGQVEQVLVEANGARSLVPADQFSASGAALILGSGEGEVSQNGDEPEMQQPDSDTAVR